ncbi:MAG: YfiM family protein [Gammaproteobacteria bacterium]|nr:YfiM family protein [Gammaproteobacteria bacterium]MDH5727522.1 YfiM family protein [Gammaproteobacteria bacterium]
MSWDYGTNTPHFTKERYFDRNTSHGGADKMGHFYTNYVLTELLSGQFRAWGYSTPHAAKLGFWSGLGLLAFVELGDSVSDYGFSYQDFVMDSLGSVMGYLRFTQPQLAGMLDIRVEYIPTFNTGDFFTDYEGLKYLFAFKLKSINSLAHSHFNLLELQLGYYTRGYEHITNYKQTQRNVFFAIGINISETLRTVFNTKRQYKLFQYIQPPYTHLAIARDLNKL